MFLLWEFIKTHKTMIDLKDYEPEEITFKLPSTVKFPEIIFSDCVCMDDVKKKLQNTS